MKLRLHIKEQEFQKPVHTGQWKNVCLCGTCRHALNGPNHYNKTTYECYHKDHPKPLKRGLLILESSPQYRTIHVEDNKGIRRVPFPYVYYVISYQIVNNNGVIGYKYLGGYDAGLRVYWRHEPITDICDNVYLLPTDSCNNGVVCTPHEGDNLVFDTLPKLTNHAIGLWFSSNHDLYSSSLYGGAWEKTNISNMTKEKWFIANCSEAIYGKSNASLYERIESAHTCTFNIETLVLPKVDCTLVNEQWPTR